jgi:hypothetical protein
MRRQSSPVAVVDTGHLAHLHRHFRYQVVLEPPIFSGYQLIHERAGNCRSGFCRLCKGWTTFGTTSLSGPHVASQRCHFLADSRFARAARRDRFGIEHHSILSKALRRDSAPTDPVSTGNRCAVRIAVHSCDGSLRATVDPGQENARPARRGLSLCHRPCGSASLPNRPRRWPLWGGLASKRWVVLRAVSRLRS